jgi:hypothetical protein
MFSYRMAWTAADEFLFCVKMGLRKGLALVRGMRRALTDEEQERVATQIVEQLRYGWKVEPDPPPIRPGPHSKFARKPDET